MLNLDPLNLTVLSCSKAISGRTDWILHRSLVLLLYNLGHIFQASCQMCSLSLSWAGNSIVAALSSARIQFVTGGTKFLSIRVHLFTFFYILKGVSQLFLFRGTLRFKLPILLSLLHRLFDLLHVFFLHAVWDKYWQEDSLCTKCAI